MSVFEKFRSEMEEESSLQSSTIKLLRGISERARASGQQIIVLSTEGIRVAQAHKGFLLCDYIVPNGASDEDGNWHPGSIVTIIDNIGSLATFSLVPAFNVSVDFSISFFSTAKVQEEVEVEAKVVEKKGRLTCVGVHVRKKESRELIALGRQWMAATNVNAGPRTIGRMRMESVQRNQSLLQSLCLWKFEWLQFQPIQRQGFRMSKKVSRKRVNVRERFWYLENLETVSEWGLKCLRLLGSSHRGLPQGTRVDPNDKWLGIP